MGDYDDEDNSDQYMAESLKEAQDEVKEAHGQMPDLSSKIKKLYAESNPTKPSEDNGLSDDKTAPSASSDDIVNDALTTSSKLSFDGSEVDVKNQGNGANSEENKELTKAATHQALLDVNKELGIKTEEKKKEVKKETKKAEVKKEEPKKAEVKKEEPKKEEPKQAVAQVKKAEVKKEEPKAEVKKPAEVKKEEPKKEQPKTDLVQKKSEKNPKKHHKKGHKKHHKKHHHHKEESESEDEQPKVAATQKSKKKSKKHAKHNLLQGGDDIDSDDIFGEQESEDKEIMKSIAYAEHKLNAKMGTPTKVAHDKNTPVKYDVEDIA
jgi:hypothetical protein